MFSMTNIINNSVLHNWDLLGKQILSILTKKKKKRTNKILTMWGQKKRVKAPGDNKKCLCLFPAYWALIAKDITCVILILSAI